MITRRLANFYLIMLCVSAPIMAQNVVVTIGAATVDGYSSDIEVPVILTNPNDGVAGIQFDVEVAPDMISLSGADAVGAASGFTADYNSLSDNVYRVLLYNAAGNASIAVNADTVIILHFDGSSIVSAQINLLISGLIVSDSSGGSISSTGSDGSITIGQVVSLALTDTTGDVNETVSITVDMDNGGIVGGVQFDLYDSPDYVTVSDITTTDRTSGFTVTMTDIDHGTRVLVYDDTGNNISAGTGPILNLDLTIHSDAYGGDVALFFNEVVVSDDIGGVYWIAGLDTGIVTVFPGYMEEPHNLIAISGLDGEVPLSWDPPVGPIPPIAPFTIEILTDDWPLETSWDLVHLDADTIVGSITAGDLTSMGTLYTWDFELASGGYMFTIYDTYGDGICCGFGQGYYSLILDGNEIASGGEFGSSESVTFNTNDGRYNIVQYNYVTQLPFEKEINTYITREDFAINIPIFIERGLFETTYLNDVNIDARESDRDVPVTAYNIYRTIDGTNIDMIASVGPDVLTYMDEDVINGTTYYYYIKADYSPDGTESDASNIAEATPIEWVELSISSGAALSGATDTLEIFINNESEISSFFFVIEDEPDYLIAQYGEIFETDRTTGWYLDVNEVGGNIVVTGSAILGNVDHMSAGDGAVCKVIVMATSQDQYLCNLNFTTSTQVKDANGNDMNWTAEEATFDVSVETQYLVMTNTSGNPGDEITIPLLIKNTQDVYGIRVHLTDVPNHLMGIDIVTTNYQEFNNWTITGINYGNEYQIFMYDIPFSNPIPVGTGHIADISFIIDSNAPPGTTIELTMGEVLVVDQNNLPIHTEFYESSIYVGTPEAIYSIGDVDQTSQTFTIELENTEPVGLVELKLADVPEGIEIINVVSNGRYSGPISSSENDDGEGYILAFDSDPTANIITVGSGPILEVSYDVRWSTGYNGDVITWLSYVNSTDPNFNSIPSSGNGFAILEANLSVDEEIEIPVKFALHPAYPNPFNPMTNIRYDLPQASYVDLRIFDITGREVRTLAKGFDHAGTKTIIWDAKDNHGQSVSAGVYIYRLESSGLVQSQKLILLK